ncbi:MAG: PadR family transcriptional regulator [Candidatus Nanopelagicales bacterium]
MNTNHNFEQDDRSNDNNRSNDNDRGRGRGRHRGGPGGPPRGGPRGGHRRGRGGRRSRGDVRLALLALVAEEPRHGYELMQAIDERTDGGWQPSPGSIYPALALLQDEGLVRVVTDDSGRGIASLTDQGIAYMAENGDAITAVWESAHSGRSDARRDAGKGIQGVALALKQVIHVGSPEQVSAAAKVLADAQRSLYLILAQDPAQPDTENE